MLELMACMKYKQGNYLKNDNRNGLKVLGFIGCPLKSEISYHNNEGVLFCILIVIWIQLYICLENIGRKKCLLLGLKHQESGKRI